MQPQSWISREFKKATGMTQAEFSKLHGISLTKLSSALRRGHSFLDNKIPVTEDNIIDNKDGTISCPISSNPHTEDRYFIIDRDKLPVVLGRCWHVFANPKKKSFVGYIKAGKSDVLHKILYPEYDLVDHISREGSDWLDNSQRNIREATHIGNARNSSSAFGSSSDYLGVSKQTQTGKWRARIMFNRIEIGAGCFEDEDDAAQAYDILAQEYFGEYANLNLLDMEIPD